MIRRYTMADAGGFTKLLRKSWDSVRDDSFKIDELGNHVNNLFSNPNIYILGRNPKRESIAFYPLNHCSCQIHINLAQEVVDKVKIARKAVYWMYENTKFTSITASIPEKRKDVRYFATACGLKRVGRIPCSFLLDGVLQDQIIYQCSINDFEEYKRCQQQ